MFFKKYAWPLFFLAAFGLLIWYNKRDFTGTIIAGEPTIGFSTNNPAPNNFDPNANIG